MAWAERERERERERGEMLVESNAGVLKVG